MFSARQLAGLRTRFAALACQDDCTITRKTGGTRDSLGSPGATGSTTQTQTVKADVVQPGSGTLAEYASKIGAQFTWQVEFPYGTDVREGDTLTVQGKSMQVQALLEPDTFRAFTGVLASEVQ